MTTQNNGGLAFPRPAVFTPTHALASVEQDGMTLRDYFAAKVMPSLLVLCSTNASAALEAYKIADAMLEARQK